MNPFNPAIKFLFLALTTGALSLPSAQAELPIANWT